VEEGVIVSRLRSVLLIMLGLLMWGAVHAYGAYLLNHNPMRGIVIGAFTGGFLAFWSLLIYLRWDHLTGAAKGTQGRYLGTSVPAPGLGTGEGASDPAALPTGRESS
jgi:hypothetical protein